LTIKNFPQLSIARAENKKANISAGDFVDLYLRRVSVDLTNINILIIFYLSIEEMNMTIEEFWNQAFLAALNRVAAKEAKIEADTATELCILHWQELKYKYYQPPMKWQRQDIGATFIPEHPNDPYPGANPFKVDGDS
jgi:hypothetical protein